MQRKRLALTLAVLTLLIYAVLMLAYRDFVRQNIVVPIVLLVWIAAQAIRGLHQAILLGVLIAAGMVIAIFSLLEFWHLVPASSRAAPPRSSPSRYKFWLGRCRSMKRGSYSLEITASELRRFLLSLLSYQEHQDTSEVENQVAQGSLEVPPAVYDLIVMRRLAGPDSSAAQGGVFARLREAVQQRFSLGETPAGDEIDQRLEQVIAYIEDRLEGTK